MDANSDLLLLVFSVVESTLGALLMVLCGISAPILWVAARIKGSPRLKRIGHLAVLAAVVIFIGRSFVVHSCMCTLDEETIAEHRR